MCKNTIFFLLAVLLCVFVAPETVDANHPVLVEGESDFDGDGRIGVAETLDGDRIFGGLADALAANLGAINNNGTITIVTSGRFAENLLVTAANGNVTIEAAPGVEASIDAVLAGLANNEVRQNSVGITVDASDNRSVILRNLTIRNWSEGVVIVGDSHVTMDNCRIEQNLNYGIRAVGKGVRATITNTQVIGTGFRVGAAGNAPDVQIPTPGVGISFTDGAKGFLADSTATRNFGKGLETKRARVRRTRFVSFDNGPRGT